MGRLKRVTPGITPRIIKVGCCGFRMPQPEYTQLFQVVEVQQTFYQPPLVATLERWRAAAPKEFEFTLKAWQLITHESRSPTFKRLKRSLSETELAECGSFRPTAIVKEAWLETLACARALKAKRILFQCPASFTPVKVNVDNLVNFFQSIERTKGLQCLWEPRGVWPPDLLAALCRDLDLTHVVDPFAGPTVTPGRCYYRLHGRRTWRHAYDDQELRTVLGMLPRDSNSYVLFNNVRMVEDALRFQEMIRQQDQAEGG